METTQKAGDAFNALNFYPKK